MTAIDGGRSVDTSMGFTPADGAVMATRSGSLDPGLVLHLVRTSGLDTDELGTALTERAGLAGLAGLAGGSGDMREVLAARAAGDPEATTAVRVYLHRLHRLRREIAAAASSLESLDALVLTGGVAEGSAWIRSELVTSLGLLDVQLDHQRNQEAAHDALLSQPGAPVAVLLIQAREDAALARGAAAVVPRPRSRNWSS